MTVCKIKFLDLQNNKINSGELLRGLVDVTVNDETTIRAILIRISAKTVYRKETSRKVTKKTKTIFDSEIGLVQREKDFGHIKLSAGTHQYPFEFRLPLDLPSTITSEYGYTNYKVRIYVQNLVKTKKAEEKVFVTRTVDLNSMPELCEPVNGEMKKAIAVQYLPFIHSSGKVEIKGKMAMSGYVPYQMINLEINVNNSSDKAISYCLVKLVKHVKCYLKGFAEWASIKDFDDTTLVEIRERGCDRMKSEEFRADICIPVTQPTDLTSDMISIYYAVEIVGVVELPYKNIVLELPITIGTTRLLEK